MSSAPEAVDEYHAHIYFDEATVETARALRGAIEREFSAARLGNFNERPRGPHLRWSFEVAFGHDAFGSIVPWLAHHRGELAVLVHPDTEDEVTDHTAHAIWMGEILDLDLGALRP
jgi:DOPA 4,5-dioxygenase